MKAKLPGGFLADELYAMQAKRMSARTYHRGKQSDHQALKLWRNPPIHFVRVKTNEERRHAARTRRSTDSRYPAYLA